MATIEFIQKRIDSKEKEIEKLTKKLERIRKVESQGWKDPNPYYYTEYDLKVTLKDIEASTKALNDYKAQLVIANEKANSRNIQVIIDFLNQWKENVKRFYINSLEDWEETLKEYQRINSICCNLYNNGTARNNPDLYEEVKAEEKEAKEEHKRYNFLDRYIVTNYINGKRTYSIDEQKLDKELQDEANAKYDFIIERTNAITGTITDATNLKIGAKGDLNGYIIGEKGTAKVQTIGAGGYNIQCYHFRTLINKAK